MIQAEDYSRWQCFWDQLSLLTLRLEILEKYEISSVDLLIQIRALVHDIQVAQSLLKLTVESNSEISSPRITELQEGISLRLAKLEIVARKLKEFPGDPGPLRVDSLKGHRQELFSGKEELVSVVEAAFKRLKLK